jgi:hypothetical protein
MRADPVLAATLAAASGQPVRRKAGQETAWPMRASDGSAAAPASFAQRWRSTWPAGRRHRDALESVLRLVNVHRAEVAGLPDGSSSEATREHLERRLLSVFRRNPSSPAAAIAWLGLTAIDAARLRGAIVVRAIRDPHGDVP